MTCEKKQRRPEGLENKRVLEFGMFGWSDRFSIALAVPLRGMPFFVQPKCFRTLECGKDLDRPG